MAATATEQTTCVSSRRSRNLLLAVPCEVWEDVAATGNAAVMAASGHTEQANSTPGVAVRKVFVSYARANKRDIDQLVSAHQRRLGHRLPRRTRRAPHERHPHRRLPRPTHPG